MSALTLDDLASAPKLRCESVPMPEFGEGKVVWLAELTAYERETRIEVPFAAYRTRIGQENAVNLRAFTVAACWCKSEARDFLNDDDAAITKAAEKLCSVGTPFYRMFDKVEKLNALSDSEKESIEKN